MTSPVRWLVAACLTAFLSGQAPTGRCDPVPGNNAALPSAPLHRTARGHLTVQATANGRPLWFVIDTASPATVIDVATPPKLGFSTPKGGRVAASGVVSGLRIGGAALGEVTVSVARLDTVLGKGFGNGNGAEADGILGLDVLAAHGAVIDLGRRTVSLDTTPGQRRELAQRAAREGRVAIALSDTSGQHAAVPCILNNDPYRLVVDTGSPHTVVQRAVADPADLAHPARTSSMRTLYGVTDVSWVPLRHWSIGDFPVTDATVGVGDFHGGIFDERTRSNGQVVGLLGLEWLIHWGAIIDFGNHTVYLKHP